MTGLSFFLLFRAHFRQFATKLSAGRPDSYTYGDSFDANIKKQKPISKCGSSS